MDIEQYSNMVNVEGFNNKKEEINIVDEKIKEKSISGKKNKIANIISLILICLGLAIIITYLGATLLFFVASISTNIENCKKKDIFEFIFPTEEIITTTSSSSGVGGGGGGGGGVGGGGVGGGGGGGGDGGGSLLSNTKLKFNDYFKDIKDCVRKNENVILNCETKLSEKKFDWDNPGLYEWFLKSHKESNNLINGTLKKSLEMLPTDNLCGITFAFAWLYYLILLIISIFFLPLISGGLFVFNTILNGFDYFLNKNKDGPIIQIIKLCVGLFVSFSIFFIVGISDSITLIFKMLFYPLIIGAGDIILKIINQNLFIVKIVLMLISIIFISLLSNKVNKNIFNGILIGYLPLMIYNLWNLL